MKFFTNQSIWKKIVIALLIVLLFNVVVMKPVHADVVEFGGKLMSPILSLFVSLGDGIMDVIGRTIMGNYSTLYEVKMGSTFWEVLGTIIVAVVAAAIAIVAIVATMGLAAVALAAVGITATVTVGMGTVVAGVGAALIAAVWFNDEVLPDDLYLPLYTYSAEEIFKGNIMLFDVNFFQDAKEIYAMTEDGTVIILSNYNNTVDAEKEINDHGGAQYYYYKDVDGREIKTSNQNAATMLKKTVSSWYNALRNICLVLMLSILIYIGIRMLLASVASDKAKYLTMLKDWFIGLCLLFLIHYIMAFSVTVVEKLIEIVKTSVDENAYTVTLPAKDKLKDAIIEELHQEETIQEGADGNEYVNWPTNLMGSLRLRIQMQEYGGQYIGLCICFIMLCLFTLYFTVTYLKRVLHMAFLTLIAPMVALTYCIDKLNDGQAQGFNKWFKEYIFNLLIQPMHLLLYYILVTSAFELASTNVIYSIVAIGFMLPAEKLLRSLFGFEKAQTAPAMGPAGAMMASSALTHLLHKGQNSNSGGKDGNSKGDNSNSDKVPMPRESNPMDAFSDNNGNIPSEDSPSNLSEPQELDDESLNAGTEGTNGNNLGNAPIPMGLQQSEDGGLALPADGVDENDSGDYSIPRGLQATEDGGFALGIGGEEDEKYQGLRDAWKDAEEKPKDNKKNNKEGKSSNGAARRIKRMAHASWAAQKAAIKGTPQKLKRKIENSHPMKAMGRMAAGAVVGGAAGALGLAIAASSGDLGNVAKIGGAAAATGFAVGSGRAKNIQSPMQDEAIQEAYETAYSKGTYKEDAMNDYMKNYKKDVRNQAYFEEKFGKKEAKEMLSEGGEIDQYLQYGITDKNEMKAMHKLIKDKDMKDIDTVEKAIAVSQLSSMIGSDTNNMTTKKREEWATRIGDMAGESGIENKQAFAENRLKELDKYNDFKNR